MSCKNFFYKYNKISNSYDRIPCGWCIQCRIDRRNYYRDKFEYALYKDFNGVGTFSFLSYDDYHIPVNNQGDYTLRKQNSVNFIKRVRSYIRYHYTRLNIHNPFINNSFKFIAVGEYGDEKFRPHEHLLFAGIDFSVADQLFRSNWKNAVIFDNGPIEAGGVDYVLKYIDKQQHGEQLDLYYDNDIEPPFMHCSHSFGNGLYNDCFDGYYLWHNKKRPLPNWVKRQRLCKPADVIVADVANYAFSNKLSYDDAQYLLNVGKMRALENSMHFNNEPVLGCSENLPSPAFQLEIKHY